MIESLAFDGPKTRQMAELLAKLELTGKKVLVLTAENRPEVYLSGRNIPSVRVMRYQDAPAYDVLWADALVIEEPAVGGHAIAGSAPRTGRKAGGAKGKAAKGKAAKGKAAGRAAAKTAARSRAKKPAPKKPAAKKPKKKGGPDA